MQRSSEFTATLACSLQLIDEQCSEQLRVLVPRAVSQVNTVQSPLTCQCHMLHQQPSASMEVHHSGCASKATHVGRQDGWQGIASLL